MIDKESKMRTLGLTKVAKENLLINTTVPLLVAYAKYKDRTEPLDKALNLLMALPKEEKQDYSVVEGFGLECFFSF